MPASVSTEAEFNSLATSVKTIADRVTVLEVDVAKLKDAAVPSPTPTPTPNPTALFTEDFSGYGDYVVAQGTSTKDGKMKNVWGKVNIMHDTSGYFARVESPYSGDGNGISALFLTNTAFGDCKISYKVRLNKYTWTAPLNYHGAWFMARYTDVTHHYYEYLQKDGDIEVGKKDNLPTDVELEHQLFVGPQPHFEAPVLGKWYTFEWSMKNNTDGSITITISGDNGTGMKQLYNFTDSTQNGHLPTDKVKSGKFGPYVEDAQCDYTKIVVTAL